MSEDAAEYRLDSPLLRAVQERNEAREIVKRLLYTCNLGDGSQERYDAIAAADRALRVWKEAAR